MMATAKKAPAKKAPAKKAPAKKAAKKKQCAGFPNKRQSIRSSAFLFCSSLSAEKIELLLMLSNQVTLGLPDWHAASHQVIDLFMDLPWLLSINFPVQLINI